MSKGDRSEGGGDRRKTKRALITATVSLTFAGTLQGETINMSAGGALVRAKGPVHVRFRFQGQEHRGRLVRVMPGDNGGTDYAIELRDPIPPSSE